MRRTLLIAWLLILPVGGMYHMVAGAQHMQRDAIGLALLRARQLVGDEKWPEAIPFFESAINDMPEDLQRESFAVRLELVRAKMNAAKLPEAHGEVKSLLGEVLEQDDPDPALEQEVRETLANSQFYMTWLMRLEGQPAEQWEPEIESARQNYRMLAENAEAAGDAGQVSKQKKNLEAAVRLARLDLTDLQGLPLPNQ